MFIRTLKGDDKFAPRIIKEFLKIYQYRSSSKSAFKKNPKIDKTKCTMGTGI